MPVGGRELSGATALQGYVRLPLWRQLLRHQILIKTTERCNKLSRVCSYGRIQLVKKLGLQN